jgi:hypothetical protein
MTLAGVIAAMVCMQHRGMAHVLSTAFGLSINPCINMNGTWHTLANSGTA